MKPKPLYRLIQPLEERHRDYLSDESRTTGQAQSISFPQNETEVLAVVKNLVQEPMPITVQGSRTGVGGAAVPASGHILNLSRMTRVAGLKQDREGRLLLSVQPGLTLSELDRQLAGGRFDSTNWDQESLRTLKAFKKAPPQFWPPDPSERSASIGGIIANNSRGISFRRYGLAGEHIRAIRIVDANGGIQSIVKGHYVFADGVCPLPNGGDIAVDPVRQKVGAVTDLLDLYPGSQGMFGAITEITLVLQPRPNALWGIVFFFEQEQRALDFIQMAGSSTRSGALAGLAAIDLLDDTTLAGISQLKKTESRLAVLPDWAQGTMAAVYLEIHGDDSDAAETAAEWLLETATEYGSDPQTSWAFCGEGEMERARLFRHAAPEAVNRIFVEGMQNEGGIGRLGWDLCFAHGRLLHALAGCRKELAARGLRSAIFGHAAEGPLHVCILPRNVRQFETGRELIHAWEQARTYPGDDHGTSLETGGVAVKLPCTGATAEHRDLRRHLKARLDPTGIWNPGLVRRIGSLPGEPE